MARFCAELNESPRQFIAGQRIFFHASAPSRGRINLSPKGHDTFRVLSRPHRRGACSRSCFAASRARQARTSAGPVMLQVFGTVRLTVQGRDRTCNVVEIPDDCRVLIGQAPLELLDFVVDPSGQQLIGNPAHGGEHVIELY